MVINKRAKRDAKQLMRLCLLDGLLDEDRVRQVAQLVVSAGYRNCPAVLSHFVRLVKLDRAQHTAHVESAAALPADLQTALHDSLAHLYGPGLIMAFDQRPSLIGGMRIQVGSDVYDGSVQARLAELEKSF